MSALLDRATLNEINSTLYPRGVQATFFRLTPADGNIEISSITSGFTIVRERAGEAKGEKVRLLMAKDAGIDREDLRVGAEVEITVNGYATRYSIVELLPFQQLGTGYAIRLDPLEGATG